MSKYRTGLPQLSGDLYLTDAGVETDLIFNHGIEIREFAAHTLLPDEEGREALECVQELLSADAAAILHEESSRAQGFQVAYVELVRHEDLICQSVHGGNPGRVGRHIQGGIG